MKINELIKKPLSDFKKANKMVSNYGLYDVREFMRKYGFEQLGRSGNWAKVFDHPKLNYVLKVFKKNDLGYITFVKYALQNPSPYLPKFRGKLVNINDSFSAIRMEKLSEFDDSTFYGDVPTNDIFSYLQNELGNGEYFTGVRARIIDSIEENQPGLVSILDELATIGFAIKAGGDLGKNNLMWRGDQLVIIDPLWKRG